jgi:hypothetical protein
MIGQHVQLLMNAILRAFDPADLAILVRTRLNQSLAQVVNPNAPLTQVAFDLIVWAERTGRPAVDRLIDALGEARPENEYIQLAVNTIRQAPSAPPSGDTVSSVWRPDQPDPPVARFTRGPVVPFNWVLRGFLLDVFVGQFGTDPAIQEEVAEAIHTRLAADPGDPTVRSIRVADLLSAAHIGPRAVWQNVFRQACTQGPRMVAALLARADRTLFVGDALAQRQSLIGDLLVIQTLLGL